VLVGLQPCRRLCGWGAGAVSEANLEGALLRNCRQIVVYLVRASNVRAHSRAAAATRMTKLRTLATTIKARIRCDGRASWQCEHAGRDSSVACAKLWRSGLGLGLGRGCQGRSWLEVVESRSSVVIGELYRKETVHDGLTTAEQGFHVILYGEMSR